MYAVNMASLCRPSALRMWKVREIEIVLKESVKE